MAPPPAHSQSVLPNPHLLVLERIERVEQQFHLFLTTNQQPTCPLCGVASRSQHSSYCRCLQDLPWQGLSVQLHLTVRRHRCRNPRCARKVFCERLPGVALTYARQTKRTAELIRAVGYVAGGRPGERLLLRLAIEVSDDTVLRRVRQQPVEPTQPDVIRALGVDDWAWRKGQDYGTILVDLDQHRVTDLLPDRSSDSLAAWLQKHPGISFIARDRCGLYAQGADRGAPEAQQVADRFHLLLNLSAAIERVFEQRTRELILPAEAEDEGSSEVPETSMPNVQSRGPKQPAFIERQQQRRQERLDRYERVVKLFGEGWSKKAIAEQVGLEVKTVRRWLRTGEFPERKPVHHRPAKVFEFADYVQRRWNEGCHNATRLFQEIQEKGYKGKRSMVARFVSAWRHTGTPKPWSAPQHVAPRHAAILATRSDETMTHDQQKLFDRLATACPDALALRRFALDFRDALASCEAWRMMAWAQSARQSRFGPLVRFGYGLLKDVSAVNAAVETSWSTGQVEGQINRLKMIKRQMYGRAGFELLRIRVRPYVPAYCGSSAPGP